jgi:methyl-accepting chemotaxis protein
MSLRSKILSGFLILGLMLAIAGIWSIYHFQFISNRVNNMMDNEYHTINSSINMLHALEREDSAILLSLLGNLHESSQIIIAADNQFSIGLQNAKKTAINKKQSDMVLKIENNYEDYKSIWENIHSVSPAEQILESYFKEAHSKFLIVKQSVEELLLYNENELYKTATNLKDLANRATMPGIIAIIASLVFTIMFSYFVFLYFISPINKINNAVNNYKKFGGTINLKIDSNDEIGELAQSFNFLSRQLKKIKGND